MQYKQFVSQMKRSTVKDEITFLRMYVEEEGVLVILPRGHYFFNSLNNSLAFFIAYPSRSLLKYAHTLLALLFLMR